MRWIVIWFTTALVVCITAQDVAIENGIQENLNDQDTQQNSPDESNNPVARENTEESKSNEGHEGDKSESFSEEHGSSRPVRSSSESSDDESVEDDQPQGDDSDINNEEEGESDDTSVAPASIESVVPDSSEVVDGLIVETSSGQVLGHALEHNENIIGYIDIPYGVYAKAFESPVIVETKATLHNVKEHNKRCPQLDSDQYVGERDCLTLSIFKPAMPENAPVLFHIHDGDFMHGSGDPAVYGPDHLVPKGFILVLPNYRLGPLGFLCMKNETAPGNAGLKDLTLALHWVQKNIEAFGGDPKNIIVSGDGSSGALAGYLSISPKSKDYISKVIVESGSVLSQWAFDRYPTVAATQLAENLRIFEDLDEVLPLELVSAAKNIRFKPCLEQDSEESFMKETPWAMINHEGHNIHYLIGSATYAGLQEALAETQESLLQLDDDPGLLLPNDLRFDTDEERIDKGKIVKSHYFGETISSEHTNELALCFTDTEYLGPGIRAARRLVESGATVYFYEFAFVGDFNRESASLHHPIEGAVRGDIKGYLFTQDSMLPAENSDESHMIELLTDLWKSFATTGTPSTKDIVWQKLESTDHLEEKWLSITKDPEMKTGLHVDRLKLWTELYDNYYIERNFTPRVSAGVYTVLVLQIIFWIGCFVNAPHFC